MNIAYYVLFILPLLLHHARPSSLHRCPNKSEKWMNLGGNFCYLIETENPVSWTDAIYNCYKEGGTLASFHSSDDTKRIVRYLKHETRRLFIGLWKHSDGSFEWVDKSVVTYSNWATGEPSNLDDQCVLIDTESGYWSDINCYQRFGYVCTSPKGISPPRQNKVCPNTSANWADFGGDHCYIIEGHASVTWNDALQLCSDEGGSLASFHSMEEIAMILHHTKTVNLEMHIGLQQDPDGNFEWVDRSPLDLEYWNFGGQQYAKNENEKCGVMFPVSGEWQYRPCDKSTGYICSVKKVNAGTSSSELALSRNFTSPNICGEEIISETGNILSPNYPENYSPNQNCLWKITVPENFQVALNFHVIDVEYRANCAYDYIEILDGHDEESPVLRKICGSNAPTTVFSSENKMSLRFVSDALNENSGFTADFTKQEICGGNINSDRGVLRSRNYPSNYPPNENCDWKITVPDSYKVLLKFNALQIEEMSVCVFDYVEIFDGHDEASPVLGRICGFTLPNDTISSGHKIRVKFSSDEFKEYYGFLAEFTKITVAPPTAGPTTAPVPLSDSSCGGHIVAESGFIASPNYPDDYRAYEDCIWLITIPYNYKVVLRFKTFNVEYGTNCEYDKLEIFDGEDNDSPRLGTFCGNSIPPEVSSSGNQMTLQFKSDSSSHYRGFVAVFSKGIAVETSPETSEEGVICEENLVSDEGSFHSPNYPAKYGPNERCFWMITVPEGHQVSLKFMSFEVEIHDACLYDNVEIRDGHFQSSRVIANLCGYDIPQDILSSTNKLMISFKSDSTSQYSGFSAEFKKELIAVKARNETAQKPVGACGGEVYAESGNITSPLYPENYPPNINCTWNIIVPEGKAIILSFLSIKLEYGDDCEYDYLEIIDEHESPFLRSRKFCGQNNPVAIRSSSNEITLTFLADDTFETSGFAANFRSVVPCGGAIVAEEGIIQSPNFPSDYGTNEKCIWNIIVPENNTVTLTFLSLNVDCTDSVKVKDIIYGRHWPSICGRRTDSRIFSTGNLLEVIFESDWALVGSGFSAKFSKVETCGEDIVAEEGTIQTPNYPNNYPPGLNCEWSITVPEESKVLINFLEFQVKCDGDTVKIIDDINFSRPMEICGSRRPFSYQSLGNSMKIAFLSDASGVGKGFALEFKKESCGREISSDSGTISSENYPENYPPLMRCNWKITVEEKYVVVIEFEQLQTEICGSCSCDYVEIRDGHDHDSPLLGKFCGSDTPAVISSTSNKMYVRFVSDVSAEYQGFTANYHQEPKAKLL